LVDFVGQKDHPLLFIVSIQQDLRSTGNFQRRMTVSQQFAQESFVVRFQYKLVRLATAHGAPPTSGSDGWPTLAHAVKSSNEFIAELRLQVTRSPYFQVSQRSRFSKIFC
jgi:hypothetical protein